MTTIAVTVFAITAIAMTVIVMTAIAVGVKNFVSCFSLTGVLFLVLLFKLGCVEKHETDWSSTSDQERRQASCGDSVLPSWKLHWGDIVQEKCSPHPRGDNNGSNQHNNSTSAFSRRGMSRTNLLLPGLQNSRDVSGHEILLLILNWKAVITSVIN